MLVRKYKMAFSRAWKCKFGWNRCKSSDGTFWYACKSRQTTAYNFPFDTWSNYVLPVSRNNYSRATIRDDEPSILFLSSFLITMECEIMSVLCYNETFWNRIMRTLLQGAFYLPRTFVFVFETNVGSSFSKFSTRNFARWSPE